MGDMDRHLIDGGCLAAGPRVYIQNVISIILRLLQGSAVL